MGYVPRYAANVSKSLEVILWVAAQRQGIDVYHVVKAVFFSDKYHIQKYGRPICGDAYSAAPWGPLPQVVYNLIRRDPIEMIAIQSNGDLPFQVDDRHRIMIFREPNLRRLSQTDIEALEFGVSHVADKSFDELYDETHSDKAYVNAGGALMDYRDFLSDDDDQRDAKAEAIEETAAFAVF